MNIGNNFLSFLFSSLNRNLSESVLSQTPSAKNVLQRVASSNSIIKDEYIPSGVSSVVDKSKTGADSTESLPTIAELEKILVGFLKENSTLSYNQMSLEIDGDGVFTANEHVAFNINKNSAGNVELAQKYLDELNDIEVGDKSLGEAFIEAYAEEFKMDLNDAKIKGDEVKSLQFNFAHGVVGDEFVSESTSRLLHIGDAFYNVNDTTQEKGFVSESGGVVKLGKMQSDTRMKTQENKV